ncbi:LysR family transcriptional regulator [Hyalangium rubrum]|uniref:LysR family transcriptional regulator n=1 Tax=Hyalangium rubrum TaxID=3103134 RepID=A0ABU5HFX7_9BACT|nr:LysR family transcriptional regulator [Hyalangium sp. s54d21]MDY7232170.1 LysR family transcriptional regulator [Hyalangium sp. s54d21]
MSIRYELLRTFVAAAEAGTFAAAASREHVSVSAISQKVRALEAQLGQPLFERLGRRVRLLPSGTTLLETLKPELARIDDALASLREDFTQVRGRVCVGAPRPFWAHGLRSRLPPLLAAHDGLQVDVEFNVPSVLERRLHEGALDLVILGRPAQLPGIKTVPLARETFVAVGAPAYVKRWGQPRTLTDFQAQRWAVFDQDMAMHLPWWRASFGPKAALPERIVCRMASLEELLALAEASVALVVLPDYLVTAALAERRVLLLEPAPGQHARQRAAGNTLFLAWREGMKESARLRAVRQALSTTVKRESARRG